MGQKVRHRYGDFSTRAEDLEASGMLEPLGLTLIRPEGTDATCTSGKGLLIDYALVTTRFAASVETIEVA